MSEADEGNEYLFQPREVGAFRAMGRFSLLHELGTGPVATLFLATDKSDRLFALKRLHRDIATAPEPLEAVRREVARASRIVHRNVCRTHSLESLGVELFIVNEYVHGESLAALLRQLALTHRRLPLEVLAHLTMQACLGLHAVHEHDALVHGSISPHNLLVTYDGLIKIVDLGVEAAVARVRRRTLGVSSHRAAYLAPEQLTGDDAVDRRADVFALGAVLYEMACGTRCFFGESPAELAANVAKGNMRPPRCHRQDLPDELVSIMRRALAVDRDRRYPSAEAMYGSLYDYLSGTPGGMTVDAVGALLRQVFARRFAQREQIQSLAAAAPEVLAKEVFETKAQQHARVPAPGKRCEFCGDAFPGDSALESHLETCAQRKWLRANVVFEAGVSERTPPRRVEPTTGEIRTEGLWGWLRERFDIDKKDPLVVRLETIDNRLQETRAHRPRKLAIRAMKALWAIVHEILEQGTAAGSLLERLKPNLVECAEAMLELTVKIDGNEAYLVALDEHSVREEVATLERRSKSAPDLMREEMARAIRTKKALITEAAQLLLLQEALSIRLEGIVDAVELTRGKVLQITGSGSFAQREAGHQVSVFVDALLADVETMVESVHEVERSLGDSD